MFSFALPVVWTNVAMAEHLRQYCINIFGGGKMVSHFALTLHFPDY